ncbi:MAG: REDY-like protein HapK [Sphingomonadales bacterium]|nr:REDY-like protein HapK [Sphingomonadales bacterium]
MTLILALFNLRPGVTEADYEAWARETDLPTARGLKSIESFNIYRSTGVFGADDAKPPFRYFEIIRVTDLALLGEEAGSPEMGKVIETFHQLADNPQLILLEDIEQKGAGHAAA